MKTVNFKIFTMVLAFVSTIGFTSFVLAEDVVLPIISRPAILDEGTQGELTAAQIGELLPWANNSKKKLEELKENIQNLSTAEKVDALVEGIKRIVNESSVKNAELLMKYSLNRSLIINKVLTKEMSSQEVGASDVKLRALSLSIEMALVYYSIDVENLNSKTKTQFAKFGIQYFDFLNEVNKSIFNASAQYKIQRTALEWLQWDLYRDLNNTQYAPQIVKINSNLQSLPNEKLSDAESIVLIRKIKKLNVAIDLSMASTLESSKSVEPNNLLSCIKLKRDTIGSTRAMDDCSSEIKKNGFDFDNYHFKSCLYRVESMLNPVEASDECLKVIQTANVAHKAADLDICYAMVDHGGKHNVVTQVRECAIIMNNSKADFYNENYSMCYLVLSRDSYSPSEASQKCLNYIEQRHVDFNSKKVVGCYQKDYRTDLRSTASQLLERCIEKNY